MGDQVVALPGRTTARGKTSGVEVDIPPWAQVWTLRVVRVHLIERHQRVAGRTADVFEFFADAYNLETITPPWLHFRVRSGPVEMCAGAEIRYSLRLHGVPVPWISRIDVWEPPHRFVDVQVSGPYRLWHHAHTVEPAGDHVLMHDAVQYALPFGPLGEVAHRALVRRDLERIFDFRHEAIERRFGPPLIPGCHA